MKTYNPNELYVISVKRKTGETFEGIEFKEVGEFAGNFLATLDQQKGNYEIYEIVGHGDKIATLSTKSQGKWAGQLFVDDIIPLLAVVNKLPAYINDFVDFNSPITKEELEFLLSEISLPVVIFSH